MAKFKLAILALIVGSATGLTACGGGSVSTGAGGGGGDNSSLVVEIGSDERFAAVRSPAEGSTIAAAIADLLVRRALAQTAGVPIFVDGQQVAVTDSTGSAVIPLAAGTYQVCILDLSNPANCTTVTLEPNTVVVVSDVNIEEDGSVTIGSVTSESAEDNIVAFQDPNNAMKTIVCHQTGAGQFTISVGTPAALNGHLGHGDTLGACVDSVSSTEADIGGPPDDKPGNGRPENAGNGNGPPAHSNAGGNRQ